MGGENTGCVSADYENPAFDVLPNASLLFSAETGVVYRFKTPHVTLGLSAGYNFINGDGISRPGTLFPVFYKISMFYSIGTSK